MSDLITDEMVEAGVVAVWNSDLLSKGYYTWETVPITSESRELWLKDIRAALEAATPAIAAAAIRRAIDAADEAYAQEDVPLGAYGDGYMDGVGMALDFTRDYADEMEADRG